MRTSSESDLLHLSDGVPQLIVTHPPEVQPDEGQLPDSVLFGVIACRRAIYSDDRLPAIGARQPDLVDPLTTSAAERTGVTMSASPDVDHDPLVDMGIRVDHERVDIPKRHGVRRDRPQPTGHSHGFGGSLVVVVTDVWSPTVNPTPVMVVVVTAGGVTESRIIWALRRSNQVANATPAPPNTSGPTME